MKYISFIICLVVLTSCTSDSHREFTAVTVEDVFIDSLSIRAIAPLDEHRVWFAANRGQVGFIDSLTPKLATIRYEDSLLHFRSIAATKNAVFVLSIANPGVLYKIDFDGKEATHIEEVYVEKGEKVFYDAMAFWNEKEGIAMGDPTDNCLSILLTKDGGNTWKKVPCESLPQVEQGEAAFAASNTNIALLNNHVWIASGGTKARVYHSADMGQQWEVFNTPMVQGASMTGIYSIDFFDEQTGVIFGGNWEEKDFNKGNKALTEDGGKTWRLLSDGVGPGYRSCVSFVPGTNGNGLVAVGSPGISYSNDQGESWVELSSEGFYAVAFVNDSVAFASGRNRISKLRFQ
ncbi:MAG: oxidoreductase [Bacteroidota bacterium]